MNWLLDALGWVRDTFAGLFSSSPADPLVALILSENHAAGPFLTTGGVIHRDTPEEAVQVAKFLREYAPAFNVRLSLTASVARGEGDFDPSAIDPNNQDAKPGETPEEALLHEDVGEEQEDVSTAEGDPAFKGLTLEQIIRELMNPDYGAKFICSVTAANIEWARQQFAADPSLLSIVPFGDPEVLGVQAYNLGKNGALKYARAGGGDWKYALSMLTRAKGWAWLDDPTTTMKGP